MAGLFIVAPESPFGNKSGADCGDVYVNVHRLTQEICLVFSYSMHANRRTR